MTAMGWPEVLLGDVLRRNDAWTTLDPDAAYLQVTVRLWGKGVALRTVCRGADIAARQQIEVRAGQFIMSRIDARHGAFGLVPPELDGAVVSGDFPCFDVMEHRMLPGFMDWLSKSVPFIELCRGASEGSTNRVRLKEERLLASRILLPPLDEQRRIVAQLDAVAARLATRAAAAERQEAELAAMLRALARTDTTPTPMRELLTLRPTDVEVRPEGQYQFSGVYSFGRGVFRSQRKSGADFAYPRLTTLRAGDFTYPKLMAWEGAYGIVPPECDGTVVSPEFPVFAVNAERVPPEVLALHFSDPQTWPRLSGASTGTNARRRRLHPETLLSYEMPLPAPSVQSLLQAVIAKAKAVRALNATTADDAGALLPAMLHDIFGQAAC